MNVLFFAIVIACNKDEDINKGKIKDTSQIEIDDGYPNDWGKWLSLTHTSDNNPAVSYYDSTSGGLGFAIYKTDSDGDMVWHNEEIDGYVNEQGLDVGDRGKYSSLAISSSNVPWISYYDVGLKSLRYATKLTDENGSLAWVTGVADSGSGSSPDAGLYSSITLINDNPVIAHFSRGNGTLRLSTWTGSSFTSEEIDDGNSSDGSGVSEVGKFATLSKDASEKMYIAYYDTTLGNLKLAWQNASGWQIEVVDSGDVETQSTNDEGVVTSSVELGDVGQWPSLSIDENGTIGISYHDTKNQDLKYATRSVTSTDWSIETVDTGDLVGADSSLSLKGGFPTIMYFDGRFNNAKIGRNAGGVWTLEKLSGDNEALGYHNEITTIDNRHYVACYNFTKKRIWFSQLD